MGVVAGAAALWALVGSLWLFPQLTDNNDEAAYLLQAEALAAGRLFPPAPEPVEAFRPWLMALGDGHFVPKYTPVHPALLALSDRLLGSPRAGLALIAGGAVAACYLLGREVLRSHRLALLAAGFLAASPLFLIQSATYLSYLSSAALLCGFAAALLSGLRRNSGRLMAMAGLLLGLAVFARPFDALLVAAPFLAWRAFGAVRLWWHGWHGQLRRRLRFESGWLVAGLALPVGAMVAYFWAATGSPLRAPFTLLDSSDTIGFGPRRMFPEQPALHYTPGLAVVGLVRHAALYGFWGFGGVVLAGCGAVAVAGSLRRRPAHAPLLCVAAVAVTVPVSYAFFWGAYGSTLWGGPWRFGPFYHLPVLIPLAILGAAGFGRLWRRDRPMAEAAFVGMVVLSLFVVAVAVEKHRPFQAERRRLFTALLVAADVAREDGPAVVFLPDMQGPWLLQPFALARNATYDGPVVWALDRGGGNFEVLDRFPGRTAYRVVLGPRLEDGDKETTLDTTTRLERLTRMEGKAVPLAVEVGGDADDRELFLDVVGPGIHERLTVPASRSPRRLTLWLRSGATELTGAATVERRAVPVVAAIDLSGRLTVSLSERGPGGTARALGQLELDVRSDGDEVDVLVPAAATGPEEEWRLAVRPATPPE